MKIATHSNGDPERVALQPAATPAASPTLVRRPWKGRPTTCSS